MDLCTQIGSILMSKGVFLIWWVLSICTSILLSIFSYSLSCGISKWISCYITIYKFIWHNLKFRIGKSCTCDLSMKVKLQIVVNYGMILWEDFINLTCLKKPQNLTQKNKKSPECVWNRISLVQDKEMIHKSVTLWSIDLFGVGYKVDASWLILQVSVLLLQFFSCGRGLTTDATD